MDFVLLWLIINQFNQFAKFTDFRDHPFRYPHPLSRIVASACMDDFMAGYRPSYTTNSC